MRRRALAEVELPKDFVDAMNNDLNVPGALPAIHRAVKAGKTALASGDASEAGAQALQLRAMLDVLGLDPLDPAWEENAGVARNVETSSGDDNGSADQTRQNLVGALLKIRAEAKAAKDWVKADDIRDLLQSCGLKVIDTPQGAKCEPLS